jgi:PKD repeat protein
MKATSTNLKSNMQKLTLALFIVMLMGLGLKANAQCAANFTHSVSPANDGIVSFTNTSSSGSSVFYSWSFGDGGYSSTASPTYTYMVSGTYTACLSIYDTLSSCSDSICYTISVTNTAGCSASFIPYDSAGYGYFYNTSGGSGLTSTWTFGDGTSGTSTGDITHLYASPGMYYVCLTVSNFLGCSSTYCDSLRINGASSGMCLGSVDATFSAADSSGTAYFYNNPTGTGPVYFWDFGDGTTSSVVGTTSHFYSSPGTYPVCLTVYETGGTYDSCQYCSYVTIGGGGTAGPCDATFTIVQDSTNLFNYYVYNNSVGSSTSTYFWDFGDGTSSTLQYPSHTYLSSGPYYLCLTVADSTPVLNCTHTYCDSLGAGHASVPLTLTVVNTTTGISESIVNTSLENYPNPFNGSTTISYSVSKDATVELNVFDLLGNKIAVIESNRRSAGTYTATWNAGNVSEGMYLLQMKVNEKVSTRKMVVNK